MSCQTTPQKTDSSLLFFKGKAEVFDKKKDKTERVSFHTAVRSPDQLRMEVFMGLLSVPLGTLIVQKEEAQLVSLVEKKVYTTQDGSELLERLLKMQVSPTEINRLFAEKMPLGGGWKCDHSESKMACVNGDVRLNWSRDNESRLLNMESPKSKVSMIYRPESSRKVSFDFLQPKGFETVEL